MKKAMSVLLSAAILLLNALNFTAAAAPDSDIRYDKREVTAYLFDSDDPVRLTCLFRSDLPDIPYLCIEDFMNQLFTEKVSSSDNGKGVFTISNGEYDMVIDTEKDTIHFDECEEFFANNAKPYLDTEKAEYLADEDEMTPVGEHHGADVDLGKYDIDITVSDKKVYFPYCTLNDIFADNYRLVVYDDDTLTFAEAMSDDFLYDRDTDFEDTRDKALARFVYNELCFIIDTTYGRPSMAQISDSIGKYGLDKTLDTYDAATAKAKELLLSESTQDFCMGLVILDHYFNDGGHTSLSIGYQYMIYELDLYDYEKMFTEMITGGSDIDYRKLIESQEDEVMDEIYRQTCAAEKESAYEDFDLANMWSEASVYRCGDTVFFDFDEFKDAVVEPFKWSLDYAAENKIKRFIIDLSTNSGGSTAVAAYMLSIMCGIVSPLEKIELTGNVFTYDTEVDKNLDGKFDEKDDEVTYDFEFAILTSRNSFSCANLLPCTAQDNGVAVIGETSGGGSCNITVHTFPDGAIFTTSGMSKLIHEDGSDFDSGAAPYRELPGADKAYVGFFDIDRINSTVDDYYDGATDVAEAETVPSKDNDPAPAAPDEKSVSAGRWFIFLGVGLTAAAITLLIIFIVLLTKKNKRDRQQFPPL